MAMDSACTLRVGKDRYVGKVHMEADFIDFAGKTKFRFRLTEITKPRRLSSVIQFGFHGNAVSIDLGNPKTAESWFAYVIQPRTLADRLGVKSGLSVRVLNLDDAELVQSLQTKGTRMIRNPGVSCDMVMLGVERASELRQIEDLCEDLQPGGAIWVVLPKSIRTVTKANVVAAAREARLNHVEVVDYSETQHAHKIVRRPEPKKRAAGNGAARATVRT